MEAPGSVLGIHPEAQEFALPIFNHGPLAEVQLADRLAPLLGAEVSVLHALPEPGVQRVEVEVESPFTVGTECRSKIMLLVTKNQSGVAVVSQPLPDQRGAEVRARRGQQPLGHLGHEMVGQLPQ